MNKDLSIIDFFQSHTFDARFNHHLYLKKYPTVKDFYQPYCNNNGICDEHRLYFHFCVYCPENQRSVFINTNKKIKLLIKIPTLNRPKQLFDCIDSFINLQSYNHDLTFIISANIDDTHTIVDEPIIKNLPGNINIFFGNHQNKIQAYNAHLDEVDFDIVVLASDDMLAVKDCYDQIIVDNMIKFFPNMDGVLWFDTGDDNLRTNTLPIMGINFYRKINTIYNEQYKGYFCDDEFCQIAFKMGKMVRIDQCIIRHNIPHHLTMSENSTYLKSLKYAIEDKAIFKIRKKIQFDIPATQELPQYHKIPSEFVDYKRNQNWGNSWFISEPRYDDPISVMDLYVLEKTDKKVAKMNREEFVIFAKNYFRNFRWTIPHIIHQIWIGGPVPKPIKEMMQTFSIDYVKKYPYCRYILWDEEKLNGLDMINQDIFNSETSYDCKSDIARLEILNKFGGIYIDADSVWLGQRSILDLQPEISNGILIAYEKGGANIGSGYLRSDTTRCANTVLGSTIQNPIIAYFIGCLGANYLKNRHKGVVASTGPDFLQNTIDSLMPEIDINILNHQYFYPCWWCNRKEDNPQYSELTQAQQMTIEQLSQKYPESILFHLGYTAKG